MITDILKDLTQQYQDRALITHSYLDHVTVSIILNKTGLGLSKTYIG